MNKVLQIKGIIPLAKRRRLTRSLPYLRIYILILPYLT